MSSDDIDDPSERGRERLDMLRETIDRNADRDWEDYRERYEFTVLGDGLIRVSPTVGPNDTANPIETESDQLVTVGDTTVNCDCHVAQRSVGNCRHVRAVEAHPRL